MNILLTGVGGFIGFHLAKKLLIQGHYVIGIDNLNSYYDPKLKRDRINDLIKLKKKFKFHKEDISNKTS